MERADGWRDQNSQSTGRPGPGKGGPGKGGFWFVTVCVPGQSEPNLSTSASCVSFVPPPFDTILAQATISPEARVLGSIMARAGSIPEILRIANLAMDEARGDGTITEEEFLGHGMIVLVGPEGVGERVPEEALGKLLTAEETLWTIDQYIAEQEAEKGHE